MTAKDLKNALLQEAVQGKLVPQIASEGNARDLLEEIKKEKAKLIEEKKLKKEKPLPGITEDEIPFDIPENWCWCRIKDIAYVSTGMTPLKSESKFYENGNIPWVTSTLTSSDYIDKADTYITEFALNNTTLDLYPVHTLILAMYGQGKTRGQISELLISATINQACAAIELYSSNETLRKYMKLFHNWNYNNLRKEAAGSAQPNLNLNIIQNTLFPLPPLSEQKRIVAAIEKFMPLIEEYGKKETELKTFNEQIGTLTKKAILQEAVQGKLVPQIAAEGNAKDLLEEIRKERLSHGFANSYGICGEKDKKSKSSDLRSKSQIRVTKKELPEITEDEIPFDIPENWCWCRLSEYLDIRDGTHDSPKFYDKGIPFVTSKNLNDGILDFSTCKYITEEDHKKFSARSFVEDGDILFAMIGSIGNPVIVKKEFDFSFKNMALFKRYTKEKTDMKYIFYYLSYIQFELKRIATGGVQSFIGLGTFREMLFPLPPLAEQKRIVAAIEKMLPLCEKLGE